MTRSRLLCLIAALLVVSAVLFQGARSLSGQQTQQLLLQRRVESLEKQLANRRLDCDATLRELALATEQLGRLPGPSDNTVSGAEGTRNAEIATWLTAVRRLRQIFEQRPEQKIPEMRLLTDNDWLYIGKWIELDGEENIRKAMASVRSTAKKRFVSSLAGALQKYAGAAGNEPPATIIAIAPYLPRPLDAEILNRFEVANAGYTAQSGSTTWVVREKAPVDAEYDTRYEANPRGGYSIANPPVAWIPNYRERSARAYQEYMAQGGSNSDSIARVIPYFDPPLEPALVDKLLRQEREKKR